MTEQIVDVKYLDRLVGSLERATGSVRDARSDELSGAVADAIVDVHSLSEEIVTALEALQDETQALRAVLAELRGKPVSNEQAEPGNG